MNMEIKDLKSNPKNPRRISTEKKNALKRSLKEFGDLSGFVFNVRSGQLVGGHQRTSVLPADATIEIEKEYDEPTAARTVSEGYVIIDGERHRYREVDADEKWEGAALLAANKHGGEFDPEALSLVLSDLRLAGVDMELTGFNAEEVATAIADVAPTIVPGCDEDEVPEHVEPTAKLGDIYQLGRHRLMCGDSTSIDAVETLMNGEKADMCFTSPPYNGDTHLDYGGGNNKKLYNNTLDSKPSNEYIGFCHDVLNNIFIVTSGFVFWNVNYNAKSRFEYIKGIEPYIERLWETIIWKKTGMPIPSGLTRNCEFIFCFKNDSAKNHISKDFETEFNVWEISNINSQHKEHRACFPVELPEKAIGLSTEQNDLLFEPFGGSGSTLIACEKTNRRCFAMELDPSYCDLIVARWEKYTGQKASLVMPSS